MTCYFYEMMPSVRLLVCMCVCVCVCVCVFVCFVLFGRQHSSFYFTR